MLLYVFLFFRKETSKSWFVGAMFLIRKVFVVRDGLSYLFLRVSETNLESLVFVQLLEQKQT